MPINRTCTAGLRIRSVVFACVATAVLAGCKEGGQAGSGQSIRSLGGGHPVVVIFNHGSGSWGRRHACNAQRDVPKLLADLAASESLKVHYLCSRVTDHTRGRRFASDRADEILHVVYQYRAQGIPARNIFLMGHSAGAWASLLAARRNGKQFNAVIAFAPASFGDRKQWASRGFKRAKAGRVPRIQAIEAAKIASGSLPALVYAFPRDTYNGPAELSFLKKVPGVSFVVTGDCKAGHATTYTRCFADAETGRVRRFIANRLHSRQIASK